MIGIIDYGAGNLLSVKKALEYLSAPCKILKSGEDLKYVDKIILPGVGAFDQAVHKLQSSGLFEVTAGWIKNDRPFLGICLGMQLLFQTSEESESEVKGFDILKGKVEKFQCQKVPQIGWNQVKIWDNPNLFKGVENNSYFYFLHGYYAKLEENSFLIGSTEYEIEYTSAVKKGNVYAVQFHPEKSGNSGLKLINNWINLC